MSIAEEIAAKEAKIQEMREAIVQLEAEIQSDIERRQHEAIDNLEDYFQCVDSKFENLRLLWESFKADLRKPSNAS